MTSPATLDWRTRVVITLGSWLIHALGTTWRVQVHGRQALLARAPEASRVVFTLWHGQLLPLLWAHRQPTAAMISERRHCDHPRRSAWTALQLRARRTRARPPSPCAGCLDGRACRSQVAVA